MNALTLSGIIGIAALIAINLGGPLARQVIQKLREGSVADTAKLSGAAAGVAWVEEIVAAAGAKASAEFILKHLRAGSTAAEVMTDRIKELEGAGSTP